MSDWDALLSAAQRGKLFDYPSVKQNTLKTAKSEPPKRNFGSVFSKAASELKALQQELADKQWLKAAMGGPEAMGPPPGDPSQGGGMPPGMDPAMMQQMMGGGGAPPMDPAMMQQMMGGGGAPPMDPAMMDPAMMGGAAMGGGMPPIDPAMIQQMMAQLSGGGGDPSQGGAPAPELGGKELMQRLVKKSLRSVEILYALYNASGLPVPPIPDAGITDESGAIKPDIQLKTNIERVNQLLNGILEAQGIAPPYSVVDPAENQRAIDFLAQQQGGAAPQGGGPEMGLPPEGGQGMPPGMDPAAMGGGGLPPGIDPAMLEQMMGKQGSFNTASRKLNTLTDYIKTI